MTHKKVIKEAKRILTIKGKTLDREKKEHRMKPYKKEERKLGKAVKPILKLDKRFSRKEVEKM